MGASARSSDGLPRSKDAQLGPGHGPDGDHNWDGTQREGDTQSPLSPALLRDPAVVSPPRSSLSTWRGRLSCPLLVPGLALHRGGKGRAWWLAGARTGSSPTRAQTIVVRPVPASRPPLQEHSNASHRASCSPVGSPGKDSEGQSWNWGHSDKHLHEKL